MRVAESLLVVMMCAALAACSAPPYAEHPEFSPDYHMIGSWRGYTWQYHSSAGDTWAYAYKRGNFIKVTGMVAGSDDANGFVVTGFNINESRDRMIFGTWQPPNTLPGLYVKRYDHDGIALQLQINSGCEQWCAPIPSEGNPVLVPWAHFTDCHQFGSNAYQRQPLESVGVRVRGDYYVDVLADFSFSIFPTPP